MEKTELMKEYEIKIDSVVNWEANPIGYAKYLESELIKEREKPTITYQAVDTFQEIIRNQCDEISALKAQLTWRPVGEELPEKEKPVYPKPWRNRRYNPYIVTDGHEARFAFFAEVSKDKWWFVNPHNHHEIKNVVAWKDASLGLPIPPAPEGEYKMEKTVQMIEFEEEIELNATIQTGTCGELPRWWYVLELERRLEKVQAKVTAYDRLMSGGKKTLKEWANIFGMVVAVDQNGEASCFGHIPVMYIDDDEGIWTNNPEHYGEETYLLPPHLIDFSGDWKDSLTLPDGWEKQ